MVDVKDISFGCELEWSDIDRSVDIPEDLGSWEGPKIAGLYMGSEIDIVNTKGQWKGYGTDPLALKCPVGGEIHTVPSKSINSQFGRILKIMGLFDQVNVACPNHGHIHVGIPGVRDDLEALKNLFKYTQKNEKDLIEYCCGYNMFDALEVRSSNIQAWVKSYLLVGDGKSINPDIYPIVEKAGSVEEIFEALKTINCQDYFWDTENRLNTESHRTAFNLFNLTKGETVEFRIFRASTNPVEIYSCLYFAKRYVEEALKGSEGKSVQEILKEGNFKFPKLNFNESLTQGWQISRSTKDRGAAFKHYTGVCEVSEIELDDTLRDLLFLVDLDFRSK